MARGKRHSPEQIVNVLRQIEVAIANGKTTPAACKEAGFTEQTYYRWRKEYGGLKVDQAKRLKELEQERRYWIEKLVEAAGVEPASEIAVSQESPCSVQFRLISPLTLRTDKMRQKLVR